jgi:3-oxoacyl-[acyl-carrier protein] reductase
MTNDAPIAVVTGGSAGLGSVIGQRLARDGYRVIAADLVAPASATRTADSDSVTWLKLDVTDHAAVAAAFDDIVDQHGRLDVLINNAGIQRHRSLEDLTWAEWSQVIDVNLHGVFNCLQAAGRHMLTAGRGAIINISSVSARGSAGRAPYATSKAAVVGLTATAGAEWAARGVRVNAVAPGYINTGVLHQGVQAGTLNLDTILARIPARRLAEPEEIADMVSFLVSERASYLNGQTVYVDGGFLVDYGVPLVAS